MSRACVCEHSQNSNLSSSWFTSTRDTHSTHRPPPFTYSPFSEAGLCRSLLMGHTQHERFVLRMMSALPIVRECWTCWRSGRPCDFLMATLLGKPVLARVKTLGACAPSREQIEFNTTHVPDEGHGGGLVARCLASRFGNLFSRVAAWSESVT